MTAKAGCLRHHRNGFGIQTQRWRLVFWLVFPEFLSKYCCLPRVKDDSDYLFSLTLPVGHERPGPDSYYCVLLHGG